MDAVERARRVKELFEDALALEAPERGTFLRESCTDDPEIGAAVESLLRAYTRAADTDRLLPSLPLPAPVPFPIGECIGPYTLLGEIAEGGMGVVYLAERRDVGLRVALKLVRHGRFAAPERVRRFQLERRVLARLRHPNIARLLDAGVTGQGLPYLVMEYIEGEPIDRYCDGRQFSIDARLQLFQQVCEAVEHAHRLGIVHRDVKPANILVGGEGELKLLDFGIAKLLEGSEAEAGGLTRTGELLVTPEYASPEQVRGEPVTPASDVYSLGVVLYELLTGHRPYHFPSYRPAEIEGIVCTTDPRPPSEVVLRTLEVVRGDGGTVRLTPEQVSELRGTDPEQLRRRLCGDLDAIVARALDKAPERRYVSAAALAGDLRHHLEGVPIPGASRRTRRWVGGRLRWRHAALVLVAGAIVGGGLVGTAGFARYVSAGALYPGESPAATEPVSPHTVAVLPFTVHGSAEFGYLRHGIVELLARGLDGAGALRSVDPRVVLGLFADGRDALDPGRGRRLAARAGAGLFVVGTVTEGNGRLRIAASLFGDAPQPVAQAEVEGAASELFALIDRLALQMLAGQFRGPADRLTRTAVLSGHSLPAIKAYLEGEGHYRAARHVGATEAFQRAVELDTAFALAYYRLGTAAASTNRTEAMHQAIAAAERHSNRLDARDRMLVQAFAAFRRSDADGAESLYHRLLFEYPEETEAWYYLGEVLFHLNPYRGRTFREALPVLERALSAEPHSREVAVHLYQLAAFERDRSLFDSMVGRLRRANPEDPLLPQAEAIRAFLWGDPEEQRRGMIVASQLDDTRLLMLLWRGTMFTGDYAAAERLARLLLPSPRAPEIRAFGHFTLADLALAHGRWQSARRELDQARRLEPLRTLQLRAFYATLPFLHVERGELLALRESLQHRLPDPAATPNDPPFPTFDVDTRPALRLYLLALLSLRLGEPETARQYAGQLARSSGTDAERRYAHSLAQSIRARLLWQQGRLAEALATVEDGEMGRTRDYAPAHFAAQGAERFLRAELLFALGRYEEALGWYGTLTEITMADLVFLGPVYLAKAEIHERLGKRQHAVEHYARFLALWKDCDPELRPMRDEAERRLASLSGMPSPR